MSLHPEANCVIMRAGIILNLVAIKLKIWFLNALNKDKEKKLHALKLENISLSQFKQILTRIGNPKLMIDNRKNRKVIKVVIEGNTEGERQRFYKNVAKRFSKFNAYRTYIGKNITAVKLIEYDFGVKQLGLKNEDLLQDTDT